MSIPPFSLELYQRLEQKAQSYIRKLRRDRLNQRETDWEDIVAGIREENRWSRIYTDEQIRGALETLAFIDPLDISKHRQNERNAILHGHPDDSGRSVFVATPIPEIATSGGAMKYVQRLVRVDRLRIVQVLTGFYRGHVRGDPAPLSKQHLGWLPGMEMHGEGIFLEWRHDLLTKWASRCDVRQRAQQILGNMDADSPAQLRAHPVALLIHTLSHILIKQLALESGYGVGALRERLYVDVEGDEPMAGMLIYVASAGAGGTLGGLARQATPERLGRLLQNAVEEARWCSSDPLCIEVQAPHNGINNLAACHSCCLISETACEWGNQFLDRGLLIGVPGEPGLGLFDLLG